ncbi:hypothetical protein [Bradyrhizobium sp. 930_D9_N1_4]|uniref:hypothetical protein n=1 Tax=Bradyrhizobium sp. 930_D9_N1_4 TaxID=3240374 RepID=UPI003F8BF969
MTCIAGLSNLNVVDLVRQLSLAAATAIAVVLVAAAASVVVSPLFAANKAVSRVTSAVISQFATIPMLVTALVTLFLSPRGALPFVLPIVLTLGPMFICAMQGAISGRQVAATVNLGARRSPVREVRFLWAPFAALSVVEGVAVVSPIALLGVLLGQMIDGTYGSLGQRLVDTSVSGSCSKILSSVIPIFILALAMTAAVHCLRNALLRRFDMGEIELQSNQISSVRSWELLVAASLPIVVLLAIWYVVAFVANVSLFKLPHLVFWQLLQDHSLFATVADTIRLTFGRVFMALFVVVGLSYVVAIAVQQSRLVSFSTYIVLIFVQSVPAILFLPLFSVATNSPEFSTLIVSTISGLYSILVVLTAKRRVWINIPINAMFRSRARWYRIEWHVLLPWSFEVIIRAMRLSLPQVVSAVLICEYYLLGSGIGDQLKFFESTARFYPFWALVLGTVGATSLFLVVFAVLEFGFARRYRT